MVRKLLTILFLAGTLALIILTWGSIGSAALTLGLIIGGMAVLLRKVLDNRNPEDFDWEQ